MIVYSSKESTSQFGSVRYSQIQSDMHLFADLALKSYLSS